MTRNRKLVREKNLIGGKVCRTNVPIPPTSNTRDSIEIMSYRTISEIGIARLKGRLESGKIDIELVDDMYTTDRGQIGDGWDLTSDQQRKGLDFLRSNINIESKWQYGVGKDIRETLSPLEEGETIEGRFMGFYSDHVGDGVVHYYPIYAFLKSEANGDPISWFSYYYKMGKIYQLD